MTTGLKRVALIGGGLLVGILLTILLANTVLAQGPGLGFGWRGHGPGMGGGWQGMGHGAMLSWQGMGPGMARDRGYNLAPTTVISGSLPYGYGPGACPGMGGWSYTAPTGGERLTLDQAAEAVESYLAAYGNPDLVIAEVMEFTDNFYAEVEEQSTGIHAFELLIHPYTGAVHPEPGPNMMWNTKYGHMGGWRAYGSQQTTADMPVKAEQAQDYAQRFLDSNLPGTTVDTHAETFYGYYTLHVLQDGEIVGMLSVNGFTGQVWYHNWHGDFMGMTEGHE